MTGLNTNRRYPDADAVMRAYVGSGRRHLIITGSRQSGKSTLLRVLNGSGCAGITTHAVPRDCVILTENMTGRRAVVGRYDTTRPGEERKMTTVPGGFDGFGAEALRRSIDAPGTFVTVDEIGYLEHNCHPYFDALSALMHKKRLIAAVRREELESVLSRFGYENVFVLDLDRMYGNVGCVIMASGMGVRFGGNKLMATFGGEPMIGRILDATHGIFDRRVVVTRHRDVADYCAARHVGTVLHDLPHRNDTVRLGLEAIGCGLDSCMFCPGDQPLLGQSTVAALAMAAAGDRSSVFRAAFDETVGAPVIFPAQMFAALMTLPEGKGGGYLMKRHPERVKTVSAANRWELVDADTVETLRVLEEQFGT
ncbi:MAG: hypothetical protein E7604_00240 [Ruminococcaceae bacterium]|nr:hypothetical protein [Oscillospiraceae bacterium]